MKICLYSEGMKEMEFFSISGITVAFKNFQTALDRAGIKYTTNIFEEFDILHINQPLGLKSPLYSGYFRRRGKRIVVHGHTVPEDFKESFMASNDIYPLLKKIFPSFYRYADVAMCPSPYAAKILRKHLGKRKRIEVVSNGVDVKKYRHSEAKRRKYRKNEKIGDKTLVISVGHVIKRKGCEDFAKIALDMKDREFRWFGTIYPPFMVRYPEVEAYIKKPPKNLRFTGFFNDIVMAYSAADILLFPSKLETQGIVILEAAAMGKPIIVRDIPAYEGWLFHGKNCLKAKNNSEFKKYIRLIERDSKLRQKLSVNALRLASENSLENIGKRLRQIYESLM